MDGTHARGWVPGGRVSTFHQPMRATYTIAIYNM